MSEGQQISLKDIEGTCSALNQRLRDCFALSSKGFFENAIELAERTPPLLAECTHLASKIHAIRSTGQSEFIELLDNSRDGKIDEAFFAALQQTYEKAQQLNKLQMLNRKLALARALPPSRLAILRQMLSVDPSHPFLEQDIRDLENVWFKQVIEFCLSMARQAKTSVIDEVFNDLQKGGYLEEIPANIMVGVRDAGRKSRLTRIPTLELEIVQNFEISNFVKTTSGFGELDKLLEETKHVDDSLQKRLSAARRWMNDQMASIQLDKEKKEAQFKLSRIQQDAKSTPAQIEAALVRAVALGVADDVDEQVARSIIDDRTIQRKRRWFVATLATILAAAAFPVVIFLISSKFNHEREVVAAIRTVNEGARKKQQFDDAIQYLDALSAPIRSDNRVVDLRGQIETDAEHFSEIRSQLSKLDTSEYLRPARLVEIAGAVSARLDYLKIRGVGYYNLRPLEEQLATLSSRTDLNNRQLQERTLLSVSSEFSEYVEGVQKLNMLLKTGGDSISIERDLSRIEANSQKSLERARLVDIDSKIDRRAEFELEIKNTRETIGLVKELEQWNDRVVSEDISGLFGLRDQLIDNKVSLKVVESCKLMCDLRGQLQDLTNDQLEVRVQNLKGSIPSFLYEPLEARSRDLAAMGRLPDLRRRLLEELSTDELTSLWIVRNKDGDHNSGTNGSCYILAGEEEPRNGEEYTVFGSANTKEKMVISASENQIIQRAWQNDFQVFSKAILNGAVEKQDIYIAIIKSYECLRTGDNNADRIDEILRCRLICQLIENAREFSPGLRSLFQHEGVFSLFEARRAYSRSFRGNLWATQGTGAIANELRETRKIVREIVENKLPKISVEQIELAIEIERSLSDSRQDLIKVSGILLPAALEAKDLRIVNSSMSQSRNWVVDPTEPKVAYRLEDLSSELKSKCVYMPIFNINSSH